MVEESKPNVPETAPKRATITFKIPDAMPLLSADILVSQNSIEKGLFYLTFFQSRPPIVEEGASLPDKVQADCVVRLALTPQVTVALIQILQKNFERFQEMVRSEIAKAEAQGSTPQ